MEPEAEISRRFSGTWRALRELAVDHIAETWRLDRSITAVTTQTGGPAAATDYLDERPQPYLG